MAIFQPTSLAKPSPYDRRNRSSTHPKHKTVVIDPSIACVRKDIYTQPRAASVVLNRKRRRSSTLPHEKKREKIRKAQADAVEHLESNILEWNSLTTKNGSPTHRPSPPVEAVLVVGKSEKTVNDVEDRIVEQPIRSRAMLDPVESVEQVPVTTSIKAENSHDLHDPVRRSRQGSIIFWAGTDPAHPEVGMQVSRSTGMSRSSDPSSTLPRQASSSRTSVQSHSTSRRTSRSVNPGSSASAVLYPALPTAKTEASIPVDELRVMPDISALFTALVPIFGNGPYDSILSGHKTHLSSLVNHYPCYTRPPIGRSASKNYHFDAASATTTPELSLQLLQHRVSHSELMHMSLNITARRMASELGGPGFGAAAVRGRYSFAQGQVGIWRIVRVTAKIDDGSDMKEEVAWFVVPDRCFGGFF